MSQYPIALTVLAPGGTQSALNLTAPTPVKAMPGTVYRVNVNAAGSDGELTVNDCATLDDASASNVILSAPFANLWQGAVLELKYPCLVGLVISAIPTDGAIAVSYR